MSIELDLAMRVFLTIFGTSSSVWLLVQAASRFLEARAKFLKAKAEVEALRSSALQVELNERAALVEVVRVLTSRMDVVITQGKLANEQLSKVIFKQDKAASTNAEEHTQAWKDYDLNKEADTAANREREP